MVSGYAPGEAVIAATITVTVLAGVATILRLWSRLAIARNPGVDDVFAIIAMLFSIVMTISMCIQVHYGVGSHFASLSQYQQTHALRWLWISVWLYNLALGSTKYSILFQYLRIFPQTMFRRWCYALMVAIAIYTSWATLSAIFGCQPISSWWDPTVQGTCLNRKAVWFTNAAINIASDIAVVVLPQPVLSSLNLPKRQRLIMMFIFGLGGVTCVISVLRLPALSVIATTNDPTYNNPLAAIWSNYEVNIGIICSCLPTLRGLLARLRPGLFGGSRRTASDMSSNKKHLNFSRRRPRSLERSEQDDDTIYIMTTIRQNSEHRDNRLAKEIEKP